MNDDTPSLFGLPLNRLVAFAGPYVAVFSGALADWLLVHVHFLSLFHTTHTQLASAITQAVVFGVTAALVWLGHQKWLEGWQAWAYGRGVGAVDLNGPAVMPPGGGYVADETPVTPVVPPGLGGGS